MNTEKYVLCGTEARKFSMGDIDEVSALLGELKSGQSNTASAVKDIQSTVTVISDNVKEMAKSAILSGSSLEAAHRYIEELKGELKNDIRPFIVDQKAKESEAKGWAAAINWIQGLIGGGIALFGAWIAKAFGLV
jgi:hypothetical protein